MIFALYYFLADGPVMIHALVRLLPLDQRYTQQLVEQFANVTRAVVVATLLSAIIQGLLAGVGFYLAGFQSIFFLTVLATLLAMVPFIGPPLVWVPACLWLYFYEDRTTAAVLLAIYGTAVVSTVDNIVKPLVLHGRSNLHPLAGPVERARRGPGPGAHRHLRRPDGRRLPANPAQSAARRTHGDAGRTTRRGRSGKARRPDRGELVGRMKDEGEIRLSPLIVHPKSPNP